MMLIDLNNTRSCWWQGTNAFNQNNRVAMKLSDEEMNILNSNGKSEKFDEIARQLSEEAVDRLNNPEKYRQLDVEKAKKTSTNSVTAEIPTVQVEQNRQPTLAEAKIAMGCDNTSFMDDMSEDDQWMFIKTFKSITSSMEEMNSFNNGYPSADIAAAVYGQNVAKINLLAYNGVQHTEKLTECLNYYIDGIAKGSGFGFDESAGINSKRFKHIAGLFAETGDAKNGNEYQKNYEYALNALFDQIEDKFSGKLSLKDIKAAFSSTAFSGGKLDDGGFSDPKEMFGVPKKAEYLGSMLDDWNEFVGSIAKNNPQLELKGFTHDRIDMLV